MVRFDQTLVLLNVAFQVCREPLAPRLGVFIAISGLLSTIERRKGVLFCRITLLAHRRMILEGERQAGEPIMRQDNAPIRPCHRLPESMRIS